VGMEGAVLGSAGTLRRAIYEVLQVIDHDAAKKITQAAVREIPTVVPDELATLFRKRVLPFVRNKRIDSPIAVVLSTLPQGFTSEDLAILREQQAISSSNNLSEAGEQMQAADHLSWDEWCESEADRQISNLNKSELDELQCKAAQNLQREYDQWDRLSREQKNDLVRVSVKKTIKQGLLSFEAWKKARHELRE
jgi:hypothetical protein